MIKYAVYTEAGAQYGAYGVFDTEEQARRATAELNDCGANAWWNPVEVEA